MCSKMSELDQWQEHCDTVLGATRGPFQGGDYYDHMGLSKGK